MRLAAIASALAIVLCVAVFGAILLQKASLSVPAPVPPQAAPTEGRSPGSVATVADSAAKNAAAAPAAVGQGSPAPAAPAAPGPPRPGAPVAFRHDGLVQQSQCLGDLAGGRSRPHRRSRLRLRALQEP